MKKTFLLLIGFCFIANVCFSQNPTIQITPGQQTIFPNQSAMFHIEVINPGGFSQQLFFDIDFTTLPTANYSHSFNPDPLNFPYTGGTDLTIQTNGSIPPGNYSITVKASNGPVSTTSGCSLEIANPVCTWTNFQFPNGFNPSYTLAIDLLGNKWMPEVVGVMKYDGTTWTKYNPSNSNYPSGANIYDKMQVDQLNNIWMPMWNRGLVSFDGTFWTVYNISNSQIPSDSLISVVIDAAQNKWISTKNNGIAKFDGTTWTNYTTSNSPLPSNRMGRLALDNSGVLWFAGYSGSSNAVSYIGKFDGVNWTFYNNGNSCMPDFCSITNFEFDQNNNLWFCTGYPSSCTGTYYGMIKFDGNSWEIWQVSTNLPYNHFIKNLSCNITFQDTLSELPESRIREIYIDEHNVVWIANMYNLAGAASGLTRFDGSTWQTFTPSNSNLPKIGIRGINSYNDTLWVTSTPDYYTGSSPNYLATYSCDALNAINEEPNSIEKVNIYPNPFHEMFRVQIYVGQPGKYNFQINDLTGRLVFRGQETNLVSGANELTVDSGKLTPGVYVLKVMNNKAARNFKIVAK